MKFYIGIFDFSQAHLFDRVFISANRIRSKHRKSNFAVKDWILDSGAFSELANYGRYRFAVEEYADIVNRWTKCGNLELAVSQDYMCEPFMLSKTGLPVWRHQELTIERYDSLMKLTDVTIMPVLQGFSPDEYITHLMMYGCRLHEGMRVGIGSVCKRNRYPAQIATVLESVKRLRPDLRLHGFGLKVTALKDTYIDSLLYSADSMAWSMAARRQGRNGNSSTEALRFRQSIEASCGTKPSQMRLALEHSCWSGACGH